MEIYEEHPVDVGLEDDVISRAIWHIKKILDGHIHVPNNLG